MPKHTVPPPIPRLPLSNQLPRLTSAAEDTGLIWEAPFPGYVVVAFDVAILRSSLIAIAVFAVVWYCLIVSV